MTTETIKSKIAKLIKKSESAKEIGSLEEAATFMAKAQEILMKHNLERGDLNLDDGQANPVIFRRVSLVDDFGWDKNQAQWLNVLLAAVSKFNFCQTVGVKGAPIVTIIGEEHNVDTVHYMVSNIVPKIHKLKLGRWKSYSGTEKRNTFFRGYLRGAAVGIFQKLQEQQENDKKKYEGLTGIIVHNDAMVQDAIQEKYGRLGTSRAKVLKGQTGASLGRQDGKNLQLNKGVGGRSNANYNPGNLLN